MKKLAYILAPAVLLSSCSKSFLDLTPKSEVTTGSFYKTSADAITAVNGCYTVNQSTNLYGADVEVLMEERGDNVLDLDISAGSGTNYKIAHFIEDPSNALLYNAWVQLYNGVFLCNSLLDQIGPIPMDSTLKNRVRGEAQFLRALHYFNLVRLWGPVPLVTHVISSSEALQLKRDSVATIYQQIEADLTFAAANLPASYTGADVGRVTAGAANGLLGKVYLYEKKYSQAATALQAVINAGVYSLQANIATVFTTKYNSEILYAVRYASGITGQDHAFWFTDNNNLPTIDSSIVKAYGAGDLRKTLTDAVKPTNLSFTGPRKYIDAPDASNNSGMDFPVLRYADVLLMEAEALNEQGYNPTAFTYLNQVRQRAGLAAETAASLPDQNTFRQEVYLERRLELPFECDRWFDLVRTGNAITAIAADAGKEVVTGTPIVIDAHQFVYPIPASELNIIHNTANFPQNPGY
ncbi:RagB/SusD family nutrient uptake outer membrane protein [Dinghuibacter silviterrae]|uniref:Putative outer membrane starch-binding protein n=1 Tax=Dinghuibacter silviterrae TaxID=1539049 RepID=A0A4R8DH50_9BACT|nr:RagB/SusD family nutrient uptake outer membrane protein [Dinghuibacter silviterrae]TDW97031.1 putative outer membrane starch-binding protein [Dinghuibacter silviterrae]